MKKVISVALALVLALALLLTAAPAMADPVIPTEVDVTGGTTSPPIIKVKWEQDTTPSLEDGDPGHAIDGAQFLPPGVFGGTKIVQYWVIVTDPEGVATVAEVMVNVYHPAGPPENGSHKYKIVLTKVDKFGVGIPAYEAARGAGLVFYGYNPAIQADYTDVEVMDELNKCTAEVYMAEEVLDYHQPAGDYTVMADACDQGNAYASEATPRTDLVNTFTYVAVAGFEVDFNALNYGTVEVCKNKWIAGDVIWNTPLDAAPAPNPATVRNIGNTDIKITVHQDDMTFGHTGITPTAYQGTVPPAPGQSNWNVNFDARLGSDPANEMYYDPCVTVTLPNVLKLCNTDELDFSIHVIESIAGVHTGTTTLGCEEVAFGDP